MFESGDIVRIAGRDNQKYKILYLSSGSAFLQKDSVEGEGPAVFSTCVFPISMLRKARTCIYKVKY